MLKSQPETPGFNVRIGIGFRKSRTGDIHDISYIGRVKILKKWVIISSILVLCFLGFVTGAYIKAMQPKHKAEDLAFEIAKAEAGLKAMDEFYLYHGKESYSVVVGTTSSRQKQIVWIPDNDRDRIVIENVANGKTKEEILSIVQQNIDSEKIISVKLGMENSVPLWEVTYKDRSGRYNYDYYDFKTGEWLKYYRSI